MFPSNLHKNIAQLDRQISLLENECKHIGTDTKKNLLKPQQSQNKCNKISKNPPKKKSNTCENPKKIKPPLSGRVKSTSSLQSTYSKPWSEFTEPSAGKKTKKVSKNTENRADVGTNKIYPKNSTKCNCCGVELSSNISKNEVNMYHSPLCDKKEEILHKEVLLSRSGERIEVTVTQKPNIEDIKENVPLQFTRRSYHTPEKEDSCTCQLKGQKWSDILSLDSVNKNSVHKNFGSHTNSDETHSIQQPFLSNGNKLRNGKVITSLGGSKSSLDEIHEIPVKLPTNIQNAQKLEKKSENPSENKHFTEFRKYNLSNLLEFLIDELEQKPGDERKKILSIMESKIDKLCESKPVNSQKKLEGESNEVICQPASAKNESQGAAKQPCGSSKEEFEILSKDAMEKNKIIAVLQKREEEYLSVISELKKKLEKAKEKAYRSNDSLKELDTIKQKFLEHTKISEALKKSHSKMQQVLERYALENDKLKTQLQIFKLEAQKHDVLMAGKEAEVKRYKEEIQNFHSQICDHLLAIKSNAQAIDLKKMMETLMHQSQIFLSKDDDIEKQIKESSSRQQNGLLHSSPTSTKTSVVNSSWKQISSIREHNQDDIDFEINSNQNEEKEFIHIFGDDSSSKSESKATLIEKRDTKKENKKAPSFTSCLSLQDDDDDCGYSSTSKNDFSAKIENASLTSKKVQNNIDELLQQMKLKWSKEIRKPSESGTIEDFFNSSQISSISAVSGNTPSENMSKENQ